MRLVIFAHWFDFNLSRRVFMFLTLKLWKNIAELAFASTWRNMESLFWQSFKMKRSVFRNLGRNFWQLVAFRLVEVCFYVNCFNLKVMKKSAELAFASMWRNMKSLFWQSFKMKRNNRIECNKNGPCPVSLLACGLKHRNRPVFDSLLK